MNKKTKLAILIGAVAAVVSALVLVVVFWDKLLALCPCRKKEAEMFCDCNAEDAPEAPAEEAPAEEAAPSYNEEERNDFADLEKAE